MYLKIPSLELEDKYKVRIKSVKVFCIKHYVHLIRYWDYLWAHTSAEYVHDDDFITPLAAEYLGKGIVRIEYSGKIMLQRALECFNDEEITVENVSNKISTPPPPISGYWEGWIGNHIEMIEETQSVSSHSNFYIILEPEFNARIIE